MTLTATYDATLARVQVSATGLQHRRVALVERSLNQLLWDTVRGGAAVPVQADGTVALDDYEFFSDEINHYRVTPADYVAGFETDVAGWEASGGTLTHSTAQAHDGTGSALLTPDGIAANVAARMTLAELPPVVVGTEYTVGLWVYSANGYDVEVVVEYDDPAVTSDTIGPVTVPAGVWTRIAGTSTAPVDATLMRLYVYQRATPAAGDLLYLDAVEVSPVDYAAEAQTTSLTPSLAGQIWLKSIRWPFLNRKLVVTDFSDVARPARAGVFSVAGRAVPASVSDVRGSPGFDLQIKTETDVERRDMDLVVAAGSEFFVHIPADCPVPGGYVTIGDTAESRRLRSARSPRRYRTLPCTVVAAPGPDVVGGTMTWGAVLELYGSWQNLIASNPTWIDLLVDVASPHDLVML